VSSALPATKDIGAVGREIESRQAIGWLLTKKMFKNCIKIKKSPTAKN
jgi:hypothetical protein